MHTRIVAALKRFAPYIAWLRARFSPEGYLGLQLTLGVLVFAAAAWLFGGIVEDVLTGDPLTVVDKELAAWFNSHSAAWLSTLMLGISRAHGWPVISVLALLLAAYLWRKRHWQWLLTIAIAVPGEVPLHLLLSAAFHRERPTLSGLASGFGTYSFPSGHVMAATVLYGFTAGFIAWKVKTWRSRVLAVSAAILLVSLVAFSRVYLGVHYLSDVLASIAAGVAWLALCNTAVDTMWRRRAHTRRGL
jgi:undecaprenyl-diphosphatase